MQAAQSIGTKITETGLFMQFGSVYLKSLQLVLLLAGSEAATSD